MAQIVYNPVFQAFDDAGDPLNGGLLYTYAAGTTTPKSTWADAGENTLNANPIELDSRGEAIIYGSGAYKFVLHTALDAPIWTADDVAVGGTVVTADIADGAVTTPKLASNALSADVSGRSKMQDGFVTSAKLAVVALPSGSTATTQTVSDNSTKVATTAYADAQATAAAALVTLTSLNILTTATNRLRVGDFVAAWGSHTHSVTGTSDTIDFSALVTFASTSNYVAITVPQDNLGAATLTVNNPEVTKGLTSFDIGFDVSVSSALAYKWGWLVIGKGSYT